MKPGYTVVAFYTPEYADCARPFRERAAALALPCKLQPMRSRGGWAQNTGLKPLALLRLRAGLAGPLLYLDVDTVLLSAPDLPAGAWDLAVAENPIRAHKNRICAAAFFLGQTEAAREFLSIWRGFARQTRGIDHPLLTRAIATMGSRLRITNADFTGRLRANGLRPQRTQANF
jgi:hypothetical protein